jgi:SAM-dependent methyltransferase
MSGPPDPILEGHYAKKQFCCKARLIAWSHATRFRLAIDLASDLAGRNVLDYGSGDGTFLAMLTSGERRPAEAVGAEVSPDQVADCRKRLGHIPGLSFVSVDELTPEKDTHRFDGLFCMEVLEHVPDWGPVFDRWRWLVRPQGRVVVSVPVETGPALAVKQVARRVAAWRGMGDYPGSAPYTWREYARSLTAGRAQHITRPLHQPQSAFPFHCHKGFNWRVLRDALAASFIVEKMVSSPVRWLPPGWGSQVYFVLRNR